MITDQRKPFAQRNLGDGTFIRVFNHKADKHLFKWHKDEKPRVIRVINDTDWQFQFDNGMPFSMERNQHIAIPSDYYHRVIPGTTPLWIHITEMKDTGSVL